MLVSGELISADRALANGLLNDLVPVVSVLNAGFLTFWHRRAGVGRVFLGVCGTNPYLEYTVLAQADGDADASLAALDGCVSAFVSSILAKVCLICAGGLPLASDWNWRSPCCRTGRVPLHIYV